MRPITLAARTIPATSYVSFWMLVYLWQGSLVEAGSLQHPLDCQDKGRALAAQAPPDLAAYSYSARPTSSSMSDRSGPRSPMFPAIRPAGR